LNKPRLQRELLFNLGLLTAAAVSLAVISALFAQVLPPGLATAGLAFLIVADVAVIFLFSRHMVNRLVLKPMAELDRATGAVAGGDLSARVPDTETADFDDLAHRFNEMTARLRRAQVELVRSEKLASLGQLAAGVAHEIGNPLGAVANYMAVLESRGADAELLRSVHSELDRIDRIVRSLLSYARPTEQRMETCSVTQLAEDTISMLKSQPSWGGGEVSVRYDADIALPVYRTMLEQCLVNLVNNAGQARPGAKVDVEIKRGDDSGSGDGTTGVAIRVSDSGDGVPDELRERVFDPFFTTKPPGSGTGLGLAMVLRAVKAHGGAVWIDDSELGGARFNIFIPEKT
jgi:signal transduction histidine kinase